MWHNTWRKQDTKIHRHWFVAPNNNWMPSGCASVPLLWILGWMALYSQLAVLVSYIGVTGIFTPEFTLQFRPCQAVPRGGAFSSPFSLQCTHVHRCPSSESPPCTSPPFVPCWNQWQVGTLWTIPNVFRKSISLWMKRASLRCRFSLYSAQAWVIHVLAGSGGGRMCWRTCSKPTDIFMALAQGMSKFRTVAITEHTSTAIHFAQECTGNQCSAAQDCVWEFISIAGAKFEISSVDSKLFEVSCEGGKMHKLVIRVPCETDESTRLSTHVYLHGCKEVIWWTLINWSILSIVRLIITYSTWLAFTFATTPSPPVNCNDRHGMYKVLSSEAPILAIWLSECYQHLETLCSRQKGIPKEVDAHTRHELNSTWLTIEFHFEWNEMKSNILV